MFRNYLILLYIKFTQMVNLDFFDSLNNNINYAVIHMEIVLL